MTSFRIDRGTVVVVTGASAGIGRATAQALARRGAKIGLVARSASALDEAANEVAALGGEPLVCVADVAVHGQVEAAAAAVEERLGPISAWVNNAMTSIFSRFSDMTAEEFRRVTDVAYHGYVYGTMAALRRMRARDRGVIVQVSSALAYRGIPLQSAYCGAKHAIQGFTESVRCELLEERSGVRLTEINLAAFNTPQFGWVKSRLPKKAQPMPPIYQPEVAANAILWAIEHRRRGLNVGFPATMAIAGNNLFPSIADRYLAQKGLRAQQRPEAEDPQRPNNLWEPVQGMHSAHGAFDSEAKENSFQLWLSTHRRGAVVMTALGVALAAGLKKFR